MDYAWLAPVLCAGAFAANVLIARQTPFKHGLSALLSIAAILGAFIVFLTVFGDALANLGHETSGAVSSQASSTSITSILLL